MSRSRRVSNSPAPQSGGRWPRPASVARRHGAAAGVLLGFPYRHGAGLAVAPGVLDGVLVDVPDGVLDGVLPVCTAGAGSWGAPSGRSGTETSTNVQVM